MPKFEKGNTAGKGRPKGTPNKVTIEMREMFIQTLEGQVPNIEKAFADVLSKSPEKYLDLFAKYAQYFVFNETIKRLREE